MATTVSFARGGNSGTRAHRNVERGQAVCLHPAEPGFERCSPNPILSRRRPTAPSGGWRAGSLDSDKRGWIEAWTEYQPGRGFTYEVVREGGSEYVRNKILRGMLASEQKLIAARQAPARLARVEELSRSRTAG